VERKMVVDYYPDEEGYISEGHIIGYAKAGTAIKQALQSRLLTV
jgi:hypothetical protein